MCGAELHTRKHISIDENNNTNVLFKVPLCKTCTKRNVEKAYAQGWFQSEKRFESRIKQLD